MSSETERHESGRRGTRAPSRVSRRTLLKGGLALGAAGTAGLAGLSSSAGASIERALAMDPSAPPDAERHPSRRLPHAGEPVVRPLLRHAVGRAGVLGPRVLTNRINGSASRSGTSTATSPAWAWTRRATCSRSTSSSSSRPRTATAPTTSRTNGRPQHESWDGGKMDAFVQAHLAADGDTNFVATMGYFDRSELPFYYALADAFTICDAYHCSVLGPTDPNRVMALSGTIDPAGDRRRSGPRDPDRGPAPAVRDVRLDHHARAAARCRRHLEGLQRPDRPRPLQPAALLQGLHRADDHPRASSCSSRRSLPTIRLDFVADVAAGTLPQVSWIHGPVTQCEHPATAPQWGENLVQNVLDTLTSNPEMWAHTLFILHYDENGGFFDHVPPPVPPPGTAGEYLIDEPPAGDGGRHRRAGRPRVPRAVHPHVALHDGRLHGHRGVRPHVDAAPAREALRRPRAERVGLAAQHGRRHDERARARPTGATRAARPARRVARRSRWSTRRSSSTR